jgi:sigma-B regulation protein RsbU (phosphoserine phosphatase)
MEDILKEAPCGLIAFKDDGIIVWSNVTLNSWLEYQPTELLGRSIEIIFPIATKIFYNTHIFPLVRLHGKADEIFFSLIGKGGTSLPILGNFNRKEIDGQPRNIAAFIQVHQRKKYEHELLLARKDAEAALSENRELQQLKEHLETQALELDLHNQRLSSINQNLIQFSKIISHDLQEPLRKIMVYLDSIKSDTATPLSLRSVNAIEKIKKAAVRIRNLTGGLQQYVSIDSDLSITKIDLRDLAETAKAKVIKYRDFDGFEVSVGELPTIEGFRDQIELLFFHLIDNAVQFLEPSRQLIISINGTPVDENIFRKSEGHYKFTEHLRIVVRDNGVGFDSKYKEYVFGLLKKLDADSEGLGIGLSMVRKIVENHSGIIDINPLQSGTEIIITLPTKLTKS